MRSVLLGALGLAVLSSAAAPTLAAEPAQPTYLVSLTLHDGDRLVGQPRLQTRAGEPARIEIRDAQGRGVSMSLTATPQADATVGVASTLDVTSDTGAHYTARPSLLVKLGETSAIAFGEDSATQKPFRVDLKVEKVG